MILNQYVPIMKIINSTVFTPNKIKEIWSKQQHPKTEMINKQTLLKTNNFMLIHLPLNEFLREAFLRYNIWIITYLKLVEAILENCNHFEKLLPLKHKI